MCWTQGGVNCRGSRAKGHTCEDCAAFKETGIISCSRAARQESTPSNIKKKRFGVFYLMPICNDYFAVQCFSAAQWHLFCSVCSAGRKVKCGHLFHLREGRHIRTRWILHQSHKWVPALNMKAESVWKMTPPALSFSLNPHLQVAIQFSGRLRVFFLTMACGFFFSWLPTMRSLFTSQQEVS